MPRYTPEQLEILNEVYADAETERTGHNGGRVLKEVCFSSRSNGRNRPQRRHLRQVHLLRVDEHALPIRHGELQSNKRHSFVPRPDELAEEVLGPGATPDDLLSMIRKRH